MALLGQGDRGGAAWTRDRIVRDDWEVWLPGAAIHELDTALDLLRRAPMPAERLRTAPYLNNRLFAHCRTEFHDAPGSDHHRHMIRVWNRDEGTPQLESA